MSVQLKVSQVIDRPVSTVFDFAAREHVKNHPRWDPDMELEQLSEGPIGVGTIIRRRSSRGSSTTEGTMKVVEFETNRAIGVVIHDGLVEMRGRMTFEVVNDDQTMITSAVEIPSMDDSADTTFMESMIKRSLVNIKQLIESER